MNTQQKKVGERFDWNLCLILFLFLLVSITAISSAQTSDNDPTNYALRQAVYYGIGALIVGIAMYFDTEQYRKLSWFLYGIGIFLLAFILVAPERIVADPDIRSWYYFPGFGSLQPSEFMKTFLIIMISRTIVEHNDRFFQKTIKTDFWLLAKISILTIIPLGLVMLQPDLGTSLVFIAIFSGLVLVSGITWKIIVPVFGTIALIGTAALLLVIYNPEFLEEKFGLVKYQFDRIYTWLDPYNNPQDEGYNLIQTLTAIGSGEITGKGYNEKVVFVPEQHTDFIFSVIGEEYGFIGASFVISLFFLLIYHLIKVALETKDPFSSYVCTGIICMITFHVFENIGMQIQLLPITGIPLPFISYGGSSLMGTMLAMGIIFSIRYHHRTYMFASDEK
ncbi:rod shape determining protein RodA [Bacillus oleivorans]|uniref:Rod shape determining protein RodA n=1 Tax=Bacillus oleivorans TaxID=1448271 RepID=A0A285D4E2_9BACI|nr:FtsW/RodA/SpoVE family cell cycle protein [Bacillus oleivorans]SNX74555.1 rod shape determining protein RodA [Bacillus oleivorans]